MSTPRVARLLLFHNPGFEADMDAIVAAKPPGSEVRTFSTVDIGEHFLRLFPAEVLGLDLSLYHQPRFGAARERWPRRARALVGELYAAFPFDAAVAPADDTPYWHDVALAIEELGLPFVVMFKETTHPPGQLRTTARAVREYAPVTAGHVLVNSEMTKRFIIACGAEPSSVRVIGQPRFDVYARTSDRPVASSGQGGILFLSYEADAYQTHDQRLAHATELGQYLRVGPRAVSGEDPDWLHDTWLPLRCETERALLEVAAASGSPVVVKPHRQMAPADLEYDRRYVEGEAARLGASFEYLDPAAELRPQLFAADRVVGFQTTVLLEAMALDKHTVYAAWGDRLDESDDRLIPFATWQSAIAVARSADELRAAVAMTPTDERRRVERRRIAEEWLGPLDGGASVRLWGELERIVAGRAVRPDELARRAAARPSPSARAGGERAAAIREAVCRAIAAVSSHTPLPGASRGARAFHRMADRARRRRLECRGVASETLAGPFAAPLAVEVLGGLLGHLRSRSLRMR